ncbi:hypothetical protein MHU86_22971 [Fragilaria crotonensis]|nr:hypothetical protein MHU86_22971 [Fragilaria crotonensis]
MRYWKLRLRELLHGADYQETFQRWETKIQEFDSSFRLPEFGQALDVNTVRKRLNEASKQLRIVQKHSLSHRQQSFQDLLDTYDADTNHHTKHESMRKAKIVRRTLSSESNRNMFSHIKNLIKPGEYSPLTKLKIPREKEASKVTQPGDVHTVLEETSPADIMWDTIISREEIEAHLVKFNRDAFRAAASSPCGNGTIHDALTFTSLSPAAEDLLRGDSTIFMAWRRHAIERVSRVVHHSQLGTRR